MNLSYIFDQGDPVLVLTFLLLIGMSAASWYVIFWKAYNLAREKTRLKAFRERYATAADWPRQLNLETASAEGGVAMLLRQCQRARAAQADKVEQKDVLSMYLAQTLDVLRAWMDRGLTILASVGSSAPFIGLFGTVWGIYGALTRIAAAGNASLNVVAGPMGEALVATAVGLFAAIPAVLAYNAFVRANRLLIQDYRHLAEQLAVYLVAEGDKNGKNPVKLVSGAQ